MVSTQVERNCLFQQALEDWRKLLGSRRIKSALNECSDFEKATFKTHSKILAIIAIETREELQAVIKIANFHQITVYPISGGKNWGLGSRVPTQTGSVVLDLRGMNQITQFNEEMATIRVQAGVSFQQVFDFLDSKNADLMIDPTGGSPEASVIGNTAERGHGMGPYADRADHVCNLEVVLPTGKVIRTGFGQFSGMELDMVQHDLASLHKTGVGPSLDQLFTQSNLGIITEMTVHLLPKPKYYQGFSFAVQNLETLELLIDKLRDLKLMGLRTSFRIFNDRRIISFFQQRPKETLGNEERALTDLEIATLRKKYSIKGLWGIGPWNVHGSLLSASKAMGKAERQLIKKTLSSLVSSIQFIDEKRAFFLRCIRPFLRKETQKKLDLVLNLGYDKTPLRGAPMSSALSMCYWQKKDRVPSSPDPDRDSCGVLWFCPVAPFHGASMRALIETSQSIVRGYGFDFNFGFLGNTERCFDVTGAICYDRELENSDERAMACHDELMDVLFEKGYFPYRLGIQSMSLLKKQDPDYADFMTQLKSTIDPNAILAPGRYER